MARFRTDPAPTVDPVLARALWQLLGLSVLAVVLPPLSFGQFLLGPVASAWLLALPALALLTLHRRRLAGWATRRGSRRGQITFPSAIRRAPAQARGKCALTPLPVRQEVNLTPFLSRARRAAFARAA